MVAIPSLGADYPIQLCATQRMYCSAVYLQPTHVNECTCCCVSKTARSTYNRRRAGWVGLFRFMSAGVSSLLLVRPFRRCCHRVLCIIYMSLEKCVDLYMRALFLRRANCCPNIKSNNRSTPRLSRSALPALSLWPCRTSSRRLGPGSWRVATAFPSTTR